MPTGAAPKPVRVDLSEVMRGRHLPGLDGLRALAALGVVAYHGRYYLGYYPPVDGVTIFFVLSGFLITTLLLKEWDAAGTISLCGFYLRRALRIFPAYYVFVLFSFVVDTLRHEPWSLSLSLSAIFYGVDYLNAVNGHEAGRSVAHAWSLAIEEQFYLLWPPLFILMMRRGEGTLRKALVLAVVAGSAWRAFLTGMGADESYLYNAFDTRFDNLAVGCLLATWVRDERFVRIARTVACRPWMPLVTIALMCVTLRSFGSEARFTVGMTVYCVLVAVLIVQVLQLHAHGLWRWLDARPTRFLGTLSYSIYLYHLRALRLGTRLTFLPPVLQLAAGVAATIVVAAASYFLIERPFLRLKSRVPASASTRAVGQPGIA